MAVVRAPDFLPPLIRETALATLIHQRRLTPSCGGQGPTAERTVGPARMIAESLTPKPRIREQNRHKADIPECLLFVRFRGEGGHQSAIALPSRFRAASTARASTRPARRDCAMM